MTPSSVLTKYIQPPGCRSPSMTVSETPGRTIGPGLLLAESANNGILPPGAMSSAVTVTFCPSLNIGSRVGVTGFAAVWDGGTTVGATGVTAVAGGDAGATGVTAVAGGDAGATGAGASGLGLGIVGWVATGGATGVGAAGFGVAVIGGGGVSPK